MARIELAPEVAGDIERIYAHLAEFDVLNIDARIREIIQAIDVLRGNPLIGRPGSGLNRELVIGRDARGYLALYRYVEELDTVFVLALRSQREAGYLGRS
jgi:toxin ParE1/3/4